MNVLIICNTYFQLIVAAQMKLTIKKDDYVVVVLSDHTKSLFEKGKQISLSGIFDNVICFKSKENEGNKKHIFKFVKSRISARIGNSFKLFKKNYFFDEIISYNLDYFVLSLFVFLKKKNKNLVFNSMEEGILSYNNVPFLYKDSTRDRIFNRLLRGEKLQNKFYCFFPDVYDGHLIPIGLDIIDINNSRFRNLIYGIFGDDLIQIIKEKFIVFTSVYDFEGGDSLGELHLIENLASLLGKNNLIIKVHPRDNKQRFVEKGFKVFPHSEIPWEFFQLYNDFSDNVFFSTVSGGPIFINLISSNKVPTVFMHKFFDNKNNSAFNSTKVMIESIILNNRLDTSFCYTPNNRNDLVSIISEKDWII